MRRDAERTTSSTNAVDLRRSTLTVGVQDLPAAIFVGEPLSILN